MSSMFVTCLCNQWQDSTSGSHKCRRSWCQSACKCCLCCLPVPGRSLLHSHQCRSKQCGHSQSPILSQRCCSPPHAGGLQPAARTYAKKKQLRAKKAVHVFLLISSFSGPVTCRSVLHLVTGCGVRHGLQGRGGLTNEDVPFTSDGPDGLFGGSTVDSPGVAAWYA